jgi:CBS domain-containing protein
LIRDIMTTELWRVGPETAASAAGRMLLDHRFSCLPVTEDDLTLVGIVTVRDFLRFAVNALAMHDDDREPTTA